MQTVFHCPVPLFIRPASSAVSSMSEIIPVSWISFPVSSSLAGFGLRLKPFSRKVFISGVMSFWFFWTISTKCPSWERICPIICVWVPITPVLLHSGPLAPGNLSPCPSPPAVLSHPPQDEFLPCSRSPPRSIPSIPAQTVPHLFLTGAGTLWIVFYRLILESCPSAYRSICARSFTCSSRKSSGSSSRMSRTASDAFFNTPAS